MTTTIKSVLETVAGTLNDDLTVAWTLQDLFRYGSDGQRDMHVYRPDLFNRSIEYALVAGYKQTLPATASKLIDIPANAVGNLSPVTRIQRALLDAQVQGWRLTTPQLEIDHFMYDERDRLAFEVYPPALTGATVLLDFAEIPTDWTVPAANTPMSAVTGNIAVPDLQATALQHYIVARAYAEGSEDGHHVRAKDFFALFADLLGIELSSVTSISPKNRA
jgi:hypothetical protein